ncbi:MAG: site-2 protease family protein [Gemmatimonadales bacterium]
MLVFSLVAHEYAHGYAALRQGDDTALQQGRLNLNPLVHIDPWLTLIMPALLWFASKGAFTFGGARPVQVRPDKYRHYVRGDIIVSSAGVITNLVLSLIAAGLFVLLGLVARGAPSLDSAIGSAQRMLTWAVWLNLMLASFNILPIPPLDGSHIFNHLLPRSLQRRYQSFQRLGFLPLLALMLLVPGAIRWLLSPAILGMRFFVRWAAPYAAGPHWNIFPS